MKQSIWKTLLLILFMVLFLDLIYNLVTGSMGEKVKEISYSQFRQELGADNIKNITIKGNSIKGTRRKHREPRTVRRRPVRRQGSAQCFQPSPTQA
jgi:ATP-dependent Zn protease